jgi:calcineurin-like phosphoesterase family protein
MTTFFTADTHFGHARIIDLCGRPFSSVEEMDAELVRRWNATVGPRDTVIHLGDVALGTFARSIALVGRLNGHKILIPGNHDRVSSVNKTSYRDRFWDQYCAVFEEIWPERVDYVIEDRSIQLSHYPYVGDSHDGERFSHLRPTDDGRLLIHGHVHQKWRQDERQINVGVDVWDYFPVPVATVIGLAKRQGVWR